MNQHCLKKKIIYGYVLHKLNLLNKLLMITTDLELTNKKKGCLCV